MMNRFLLFFLLIPVIGISQIQIGDKIEGDHQTDGFGTSLAMSADGNIIVVGAPKHSNTDSSGYVRVYENTVGGWIQIGNDIEGEVATDGFGESVAISNDGNIIAVGAPFGSDGVTYSGHVRIFENVDGNWTQVGDTIIGDSAGDQNGKRIALSSDGTTVAIGAIYHDGNGADSGQVRVLKNIDGTWTQVGSDIYGLQPKDGLGISVSLSDDGSILAVGAISVLGSISPTSYVLAFENVAGNWVQVGQPIYQVEPTNATGRSISLSSDGNTLAIGSPQYSTTSDYRIGHVRIFTNNSGTWTQIGNSIFGEASYEQSGHAVSLSSNGTILAIGATGGSLSNNTVGKVRIYKNTSNIWTQIGNDIDGEGVNEFFGTAVALSSEGDKLISSAKSSITSNPIGYVKVYDLTDALSTESFVKANFNIYPNPAKDIIHVALEDDLQLENVTIYNNLGQEVKTVNQSTIDISSLAKGLYFIEVHTNQGKASKKVVIE